MYDTFFNKRKQPKHQVEFFSAYVKQGRSLCLKCLVLKNCIAKLFETARVYFKCPLIDAITSIQIFRLQGT